MDYDNLENEHLATLSLQGDNLAQEVLLRRFKGTVTMLARSYFIMGGDQEDLVQEGMIGLYRAMREYRPNHSSFATFATACIKNQMLDAIKNASRKKHSPLNSYISINPNDPEIAYILDPAPNPEATLIHKENQAHLQNLMRSSLSNLESEVLKLFLVGLSYQEIANLLNRTTKAVDNALYRIRMKVSKIVM